MFNEAPCKSKRIDVWNCNFDLKMIWNVSLNNQFVLRSKKKGIYTDGFRKHL